MNIRVFALTIASFVVGLIELIIGGILPQISEDLEISVAQAGFLITIFSIVFAISGPILLSLTSKIERKRLMLYCLIVFFVGALLSFWGTSYVMLVIARIINASSGSLICVLALTLSIKVVEERYMARAIGIVSMGISSSIVLGIPIGVLISDYWNWRIVFLCAAILTIVAFIIIVKFMSTIKSTGTISLRDQWNALKSIKIVSAHTMMIFAMSGHYVFYAYLSPYLIDNFGLSAKAISMIYFVFGFAAIAGGYVGGALSDRLNPRRTLIAVLITFIVTLALISIVRDSFVLFIALLVLWGMMSWAVSPPEQAYLIETDSKNSDIQQSLHNSALQVGIALGSGIGSIIIKQTNEVSYTSWAATLLMVLALGFALFSFSRTFAKGRSMTT